MILSINMNFQTHDPQFLPKEKTPTQPNIIVKNDTKDNDEINIFSYLLVLWKRKWLMISIFVIILSVAAYSISKMEPIYSTKAFIEIGKIKEKQIENIGEIKAVFSNDIILRQLAEKLDLPAETDLLSLSQTFSISEDLEHHSHFLIISGMGNSPQISVNVVHSVIDLLLERHNALFNQAKEVLDMEIELLVRQQEKTKQDIEYIKNELVQIDNDIIIYQNEVSKRADIKSEGQGRIAESYINLLKTAKDDNFKKTENLKNLEYSLKNYDAIFLQKNYERGNNTKMTSIETPPTLPQKKIGPKRKQLAIQSGIIAIFISLFSAFIVEFVIRHKKKLNVNNKNNNKPADSHQ